MCSRFSKQHRCHSFFFPRVLWGFVTISAVHECLSTSQPRQTVSACNCIQPCHMRCLRVLTQLQSNTGPNQSAEHAAHQQSIVYFSSQELFVFLTSASCYHVTFSIRAFGSFMVMWFIWACGTLMMPGSLACYPYSWTTVFVELRRWKEEEGEATHPPKVSRAQSLDGGTAEASSSHAFRHGPTCSD